MNITLDAQTLEKETEKARATVAASGLSAALVTVDAGAFGTTPINLQALEAVSGALACAGAAFAAGAAPAVYAGYIFAQEAAERLSIVSGPSALPEKAVLPGEHYKAWSGLGFDALSRAILSDCVSFLDFYAGHSDSAKRPVKHMPMAATPLPPRSAKALRDSARSQSAAGLLPCVLSTLNSFHTQAHSTGLTP